VVGDWSSAHALAAALARTIAGSFDALFAPGTWPTPVGFCSMYMPELCSYVGDAADVMANSIHHMAAITTSDYRGGTHSMHGLIH
jgi:hypothetical protein